MQTPGVNCAYIRMVLLDAGTLRWALQHVKRNLSPRPGKVKLLLGQLEQRCSPLSDAHSEARVF